MFKKKTCQFQILVLALPNLENFLNCNLFLPSELKYLVPLYFNYDGIDRSEPAVS